MSNAPWEIRIIRVLGPRWKWKKPWVAGSRTPRDQSARFGRIWELGALAQLGWVLDRRSAKRLRGLTGPTRPNVPARRTPE